MKKNHPQIIFEGIGTHWVIDLYRIDAAVDLNLLEKTILKRVDQFDKDYSRFRRDSLVWKMSQKLGWYDLPPDGWKMLSLYQKIYRLTDGKVTPMVGNLLSDLGYDLVYSFVSKKSGPVASWDEALELKGERLKIKKKVLLDFGAAGKGYLVDLITSLLKVNGVSSFCINGGGDIYVYNFVEKVGLENPFDSKQVTGVIEISNRSICASATNRRVWGKYHHIVDPVTRQSTVGVVATWVVAREAILADMVATCLFFVPVKKLLAEFDFEYLILDAKMKAEFSKGFQGGIFFGTT